MQLDYKPTYRLLLSGPGGNEINHDVNFRAGKDLGRFAYSFINQAVLSSFPIRELPGRNRVFSNRTSLRAAYEVAPKSFILSEIGHSITTRTRTVTPILSGESRTASIVLDDFQFLYNYQLKPKLPIIPDFTLSRTQLADTIIWTKSMGLNAAYFPTTRLVLTPRAGIQFRDTKGSPTQVSNFYGIGMDYMMRPKTVLGLDLVSDVRPSFVDEGIFLREDSIELGIQEALLLRWLLELRLNYTLRTQDSSAAIAGIDQTDIEVEFTVNYILTQMSFIDFGINRYQIKDNNTGLRGKRLNIQLSYNRAF
jgi:hypothetical protein